MSVTLSELLTRAFRRTSGAVRPGLDTIRALLGALDNPQQNLAVVHVAGTNGKGSVCAMLESMLQECGIPTGMYTSPHLVRVNERFRIRGEQINDENLFRFLTRIMEIDERRCAESGERPATFFELMTALAYLYFSESGVKLAVVETGMGGRWDATNVVVPLVSVITNVSMDHTNYLGESLMDIAAEKCGIIKAGRPVVTGILDEDILEIVRREAKLCSASFVYTPDVITALRLDDDDGGQVVHVEGARCSYGRIHLPLRGEHQLRNCAVAVAAFEEVREMIGLPENSAVRDGLRKTVWHGRLEQVRRDPVMIVDGAHNPDGVKSLVRELKRRYGRVPVALICGILADKDIGGMVAELSSLHGQCWVVSVNNERSAEPEKIGEFFAKKRMKVITCDLNVALREATAWAKESSGIVVVAGSLFLVGDVLRELGCNE